MKENPWLSSEEASECFKASEETLDLWREIGYLKEGTHWRKQDTKGTIRLKEEIYYHQTWCQEEIEYWRQQDAPICKLAA